MLKLFMGQYDCVQEYESAFFLPVFSGRRIGEAAALVHVHAPESAGACSKLTQACPVHLKVLEEAKIVLILRQEMENPV